MVASRWDGRLEIAEGSVMADRAAGGRGAGAPPPEGGGAGLADGWYVNDAGELCYRGKCFGLRAPVSGGLEIEFDEQCELKPGELDPGTEIIRRALRGDNVRFKLRKG